MAYKRYIKKNGKIYGPYVYHSHRKDGKVVSKYLGKSSSVKTKKQKNIQFKFFLIGLVGLILLLSIILLINIGPSGKVSLDIKSKYVPGETIEGNLKFSLKTGELIPGNSKVIIKIGNESKEFILSNLVDRDLVEGDFYAENVNISGSGAGYGLVGSEKIYPELNFNLKIFNVESSKEKKDSNKSVVEKENVTKVSGEKTEINETVEKPAEETNKTKETIPEEPVTKEKVQQEKTPKSSEESSSESKSSLIPEEPATKEKAQQEKTPKSSEESSSESKSSLIPEEGKSPVETSSSESKLDSSESSESGITGATISKTKTIISGVVSKEKEFTYELEKDKSAELVSGSVNLEGNPINDSSIEVKVKKNKVVVSTDYFIEEEGFGEEYLGKEKLKLNIELGQFGLVINNDSKLSVELVYEDNVLAKAVKDLKVKEVEKNETTILKENLTKVNLTRANITIQNETIINETIINQTIITANLTLNINTTQYGAVLNRPVKWKKNIKVDKEGLVRVKIPKQAENISVYKIVDDVVAPLGVQVGGNESGSNSVETNQTIVGVENETAEINKTETNQTVIEEVGNITENKNKSSLMSGQTKKSKKVKIKITAKIVSHRDGLIRPSGDVTANIELDKGQSVIGNLFKKIFNYITGRVVDVQETAETKEVIIEEPPRDPLAGGNATIEYVIEYETPGPMAFESPLGDDSGEPNTSTGKKIVISSDVHYKNILAFTELPYEVPESAVHLYWNKKENNTYYNNETNKTIVKAITVREAVDINKYDINNNSLIDYIEWIVPHLSNQSYELVIEITKAEHLDENRSFIEDVYDYVKARDNNWTEIPKGDYLRVTFEQKLDNTRDITLYARSTENSSSGIEVYEKDNDTIIADFGIIDEDKKYKVYLTNLTSEQDTFDLKVVSLRDGSGEPNGSVEFDYVVDPTNITSCQTLSTANSTYTLINNVSSTGTCFTISEQNITLDCDGYAINYSTSGGADQYGVYSTYDYTKIKNCIVEDGNLSTSNSYRYGVYFNGVNYGDRKSTRLNSSHIPLSRMPSSA